jgi:pyruvate formate-lyase activating enzyme-like uncharacterized protein
LIDYRQNLNGLEFSDTNADALHLRGYRLKNDTSCAAAGSEEIARDIMRSNGKSIFVLRVSRMPCN